MCHHSQVFCDFSELLLLLKEKTIAWAFVAVTFVSHLVRGLNLTAFLKNLLVRVKDQNDSDQND